MQDLIKIRALPALFRPTSLRWRLTLTYTLLIGGTLILLGVLMYNLFAYQLERNSRDGLYDQANHFADQAALVHGDLEWATNSSDGNFLVNSQARNAPAYIFRIYNSSGSLMGSSSLLHEDSGAAAKRVLQTRIPVELPLPPNASSGRRLCVLQPVTGQNQVLGVAEVCGSLSEIDGLLDTFSRVLLGAMAVSLLLSLGLGLYLAHTVTNPLLRVREVAARVAGGDFSAHVERPSTDEVGDLARTVNYMASELKQLDDLRSQFVSNVSHELKTPLTAIKGFVVTSLDDPEDTATQRRALEVIDQETDRLSRLVDELLSFARLEAGKVQLRMERVNLGLLIEEVVHAQEPRSERYDIDIQTRLSTGLWLRADRDKLKQIMLNLLDNALKFTPPGGTITISAQVGSLPPNLQTPVHCVPAATSTRSRWANLFNLGRPVSSNGIPALMNETREYIVVHVADTGIGIPAEDLPHVFERFYRAHTSGGAIAAGRDNEEATAPPTSGTGLGLSIVRLLVEAHGGCITIESTPGSGTTVIFGLPGSDPEPRRDQRQSR